MDINYFSTNLFTIPTFLKGSARIIDLFGSLDDYNYSVTETEADLTAIGGDWICVGHDITKATENYDKSINPATTSITP